MEKTLRNCSRLLSTTAAAAQGNNSASRKIKRFYKQVNIKTMDPAPSTKKPTYAILLDGRTFRTPKKRVLELPTKPLALAVAGEWFNQLTHIEPSSMPLTTLATSATDLKKDIPLSQDLDYLLSYMQTDSCCYRSPFPENLAKLQQEAYTPLLDYMDKQYGVRLLTTYGLGHLSHPQESFTRMRDLLSSMSHFERTAMEVAVTSAKSFVVGMSVMDGHLSPEAATEIARVEEKFQGEHWGEDMGHSVDASDTLMQMRSAWLFSQLLKLD
jgi:ATP synthase F1 complex assembly factor 2